MEPRQAQQLALRFRSVLRFAPDPQQRRPSSTIVDSEPTQPVKVHISAGGEEMGYSKDEQEWVLGRGLAECLPWPLK
jgi:hypothetical protein